MAITHQNTYIRGSQSQVSNLGLGDFVAQVNAFSGKALNSVDKAIRKMVFEVFKRIVMRTPVDSGRLRGNWAVSSVYSMSSELGDSKKGTFDKSGSSTVNKGRQFIQSGMDIHDGLIAYIFNNVRYAIYLEGGRVYPSPPYGSPQAPKGMVRITLAEFGSISTEAVTSVQSGGLGSGLSSGLGG